MERMLQRGGLSIIEIIDDIAVMRQLMRAPFELGLEGRPLCMPKLRQGKRGQEPPWEKENAKSHN